MLGVRLSELITSSPEQTQALGKALGAAARAGDVLLLEGSLGAGKTCLTQGIVWGLGGDEYARSPTFVLMAEYHSRLTLYHIDLYRLEGIDEIEALGLDEYLRGEGVCVVEWADKARGLFPEEHMSIRLEILDETTRRIHLSADDERHRSLIDTALAEVSQMSSQGAH